MLSSLLSGTLLSALLLSIIGRETSKSILIWRESLNIGWVMLISDEAFKRKNKSMFMWNNYLFIQPSHSHLEKGKVIQKKNCEEIELAFIWLEIPPRYIAVLWARRKFNRSGNQGGREYLKGWDKVIYKWDSWNS